MSTERDRLTASIEGALRRAGARVLVSSFAGPGEAEAMLAELQAGGLAAAEPRHLFGRRAFAFDLSALDGADVIVDAGAERHWTFDVSPLDGWHPIGG